MVGWGGRGLRDNESTSASLRRHLYRASVGPVIVSRLTLELTETYLYKTIDEEDT